MSAGEPPMTAAETLSEVEFLIRSELSAYEIKTALGRSAAALEKICRDFGRLDLSSHFYAEITVEASKPKPTVRRIKWTDEEYADIISRAREMVANGVSVNRASKALAIGRTSLTLALRASTAPNVAA